MIKINEPCLGIFHRVTALKKINEMNVGETKDVLVQKMSDGRFSVMGMFVMLPDGKAHMDMFYAVFKNEQDLHQTFSEQFTNLQGFTIG